MTTFRKWMIIENHDYPTISSNQWNGNMLRPIGDSMNSISSSFTNYDILPGIREVPFSQFSPAKNIFYASNDFNKARDLAVQIQNNKEIEPLIIAIDKEGPYILEGAHRFYALSTLGYKTFPAVVVLDLDE